LLHQVGDLFELNVKLWCQKVNLLIRHSWKQYTKTGNYHLTMNELHLIIVVAPLFPTLRQLGHFFILGDDH
jgi:hypothetical protein